jgi:hypothetical protein
MTPVLVAAFSLYLPRIYHFSSGFKSEISCHRKKGHKSFLEAAARESILKPGSGLACLPFAIDLPRHAA